MPQFQDLVKKLPRDISGLRSLDLLYLMLRDLPSELNDVYRTYNTPGGCDVESCEKTCVTIAEKLEIIASKLKTWRG